MYVNRQSPLLVFRGSHTRQKGRGLGSFFTSLFRRLIPIAQKYVIPQAKKYVVPEIKRTFSNIANDYFEQGRPFKDSIKTRGMEGIKAISKNIARQSGTGASRKRKQTFSNKTLNKKRKTVKVVGKQKRNIRITKRKQKVNFKGIFD